MKRFPLRQTLSFLVVVLALGCSGNQKKATATAKSFLQAYYVDLDFETAKQLCSDISQPAISEQAKMVALNPYAKEEIPDITFKTMEIDPEEPHRAVCTYLVNRVERILPLRKFEDVWLVHLPQGSVETGGADMMELQVGNHGGFAAAASGSITYKQRKRN